mmetsp:Transcript_3306/g.8575  ORF Transcript_3306/g.8575 Transcript_3306/m.8575 type:complete len:300 (-) Transcript_3306:335-1234(-)
MFNLLSTQCLSTFKVRSANCSLREIRASKKSTVHTIEKRPLPRFGFYATRKSPRWADPSFGWLTQLSIMPRSASRSSPRPMTTSWFPFTAPSGHSSCSIWKRRPDTCSTKRSGNDSNHRSPLARNTSVGSLFKKFFRNARRSKDCAETNVSAENPSATAGAGAAGLPWAPPAGLLIAASVFCFFAAASSLATRPVLVSGFTPRLAFSEVFALPAAAAAASTSNSTSTGISPRGPARRTLARGATRMISPRIRPASSSPASPTLLSTRVSADRTWLTATGLASLFLSKLSASTTVTIWST